MRVPGQGLEQRDSVNAELYQHIIIIIILIRYIIIKLLNKTKTRTIPDKTGKGTPHLYFFVLNTFSIVILSSQFQQYFKFYNIIGIKPVFQTNTLFGVNMHSSYSTMDIRDS
jgi:hypothetical protein